MSDIKPPGSPFTKQRETPVINNDVEGLEIARSRVAGMEHLDKFGACPAVTTSFETVWERGGLYPWPATPQQYAVSSSAAIDSVSASGAQVMRLFGLDSDYLEAQEDITLNGQTTVMTVNTYSRIHRGQVIRAGGNSVNAGDIYAYTGANTGGVPDVTASTIMKLSSDFGQTLMALYTVPANKVAYVVVYNAASGAGRNITVQFRERPFGGAWNVKHLFDILNNTRTHKHGVPHKIDPKTDIEVLAKEDGAPPTQVSAAFEMILIETKGEIGY